MNDVDVVKFLWTVELKVLRSSVTLGSGVIAKLETRRQPYYRSFTLTLYIGSMKSN